MKHNILFGFTVAGLLFSGYLGGIKLFGGTCAFNETCATFLGYPTCYYGFAMYLTIFVLLMFEKLGKLAKAHSLYGVMCVSLAGILFAGYFSAGELSKLLSGNVSAYFLGLPTCAYGLIMYIALFVLSLKELRLTK